MSSKSGPVVRDCPSLVNTIIYYLPFTAWVIVLTMTTAADRLPKNRAVIGVESANPAVQVAKKTRPPAVVNAEPLVP